LRDLGFLLNENILKVAHNGFLLLLDLVQKLVENGLEMLDDPAALHYDLVFESFLLQNAELQYLIVKK